tara:strand:- start:124 stop:387 length:264 start_codon:yes stop_codon:yes gene_type:complete
MNDIIEITEEEAKAALGVYLNLVDRNRCVFRIQLSNGSAAMLSPVIQSGPPVDPEVMDQVEEFKKSFMEEAIKITPDDIDDQGVDIK